VLERIVATGGPLPTGSGQLPPTAVKEISLLEVRGRFAARFVAISGGIALLIKIPWVMLDLKCLASGFSLTASSRLSS